jgi:hypothetical protein
MTEHLSLRHFTPEKARALPEKATFQANSHAPMQCERLSAKAVTENEEGCIRRAGARNGLAEA